MVNNIYKIPNIILGDEIYSGTPMVRTDASGMKIAEIYSVSDEQLRRFKRNTEKLSDRLAAIPIVKIFEVIKKIPDYYFKSYETIDILKKMTSCTEDFIHHSMLKRINWCKNIETFAIDLIKSENETQAFFKGEIRTCNLITPKGPAIAILPKNSDEESLYLIVQALIAKTPILIRSSQWGPSSLSSIELFRSISKIVSLSENSDLKALAESICVVNMFETNREKIIEKLHINNASYILFGSQETISDIIPKIKQASTIIALGTGLSCAFVMEDADISLAAKETIEGVMYNNGGECISTSVIYIHESVQEQYIEEVIKKHNAIFILEHEQDQYLPTGKALLIKDFQFAKETGCRSAYFKIYSDTDELKTLLKKDLQHNVLKKKS